MPRLLACPFCRELFREDEGVDACPACGLGLRPLAGLPSSSTMEGLGDEEELDSLPSESMLHWGHWRHGRGPLFLIASLGVAGFFAPWLELLKPEHRILSGFALARSALPWLWAGPVAWFISLPLLVTRRSLSRLHGIRLIASLFAAMTLVDVLILAVIPANSRGRVPVAFEWMWGIWVSGAISVTGIIVATRLGAPPWSAQKRDAAQRAATEESNGARRMARPSPADATTTKTSLGETLH